MTTPSKTFDIDVTFRVTITDPDASPFTPKTKAEVGTFLESNLGIPGVYRDGMEIAIVVKYPEER